MMVVVVNIFKQIIAFGLPSFLVIFNSLIICLCVNPAEGQTQPRRYPYDTISDAFPAPNSGEHDVFVSRILRWHIDYCGENRVCTGFAASNCYRCAPCQCDLGCHDYGDCCPDIAMETKDSVYPRPFTGNSGNDVTCESSAFKSKKPEDGGGRKVITKIRSGSPIPSNTEKRYERYFMVSQCPNTFTGDTSKCESNDMIIPVTSQDNDSSVVYKSIHCAYCHGVFDVIPWNVQISCENRKNFTSFQTPHDVTMMTLLEPDCTVFYTPPASKEARKCYTEPRMIFRCNVTGKWNKRDSFLERACYSYVTPKLMNGQLYKNVFCYLCNQGDDANTQVLLKSCQKNPSSRTSKMVLTLRHSDVTRKDRHDFGEGDYQECEKNGIYDHLEKSCREVTCALGQHLVSGTCQPMFLTARGLGYELYFALRPQEPIDLSGDHDLLHHLPAEIEIYLGKTLLEGNVKLQDFAVAFNTTDQQGRCSQRSSDLGLYARLVSEKMVDQRQLQNELLRVRHAKFSLATRTWNISFQGFPSESPWHVMHPARRLSPQRLSACVIIVSNNHLEQRKAGTMRVGTTTPDPSTSPENQTPPHVRLSSLLGCPHVRLAPYEYLETEPGADLTLSWTETTLPKNKYLMDIEGNVTICLSDFLTKLGDNRHKRSTFEKMLTSVLLAISLFLLILSLVVFVAFAVLRSLAGKNNMILIACLFCSQALLLAGYFVDDTSNLCVAIGALTHYFTLCFFCSIIVCSYHVYTMFTTMHLSQNVTRECRVFSAYCSFTFFLPLIIVGSVIIIHVVANLAPTNFGYGGAVCLLTSSIALWVALLLPLVVSCIMVTALFCLTRFSLLHTKDVETNASDERHVHFYFRTSLLTLVIWIVGTIAIVTSLFPVRITFVILECLLGIFVFVTLMLTKRVIDLVYTMFFGPRQPQRGRTSLNLKMASSTYSVAKNPPIVATGFRKTTSTNFDEARGNHHTNGVDVIETET